MTGQHLSDFMVAEKDRLMPGGVASLSGVQLQPLKNRKGLVLVTRLAHQRLQAFAFEDGHCI